MFCRCGVLIQNKSKHAFFVSFSNQDRFCYTKINFESRKPGYWENSENIIQFLKQVQEKLNLKTIEQWNTITSNQIKSLGGGTLLNKHSIFELKCMAYPEGQSFYTVKQKPSGYWQNKENVIKFLSILKEKNKLETAEDWNLITYNQFRLLGGSTLLNIYSIFELKCLGYPDGKLYFQSSRKSSGYWENKLNILQFLHEIKEKYSFNSPEDWNLLTRKHIELNGGGTLLNKYSLFELKCFACPEGKLIFNPSPKPSGYWDNKENVIHFLHEIKVKYNLNSPKDWNSITFHHIQSNGGRFLFQKYSLFELKCLACPEGKFIFDPSPKPSGYWDNIDNIFQFLNELKIKYNLQTIKDWNELTSDDIQSNGGSFLLQKYSMFDLKCLGCPEGKFIFDKPISYKPSGFWDNEDNIRQFISQLKEKYNLTTSKDWSRLSKLQIRSNGGEGLLHKYSLTEIIKLYNPNVNIEELKDKRASQRWLFLQIQKLFPHEEIVEDYFHTEISRKSGFAVQFDIFLTNKKIAIEYHGAHHYKDIPTGFGPIEMFKNRDKEKQKLCKEHGIQLIIIPYWWDNDLQSLKVTLEKK